MADVGPPADAPTPSTSAPKAPRKGPTPSKRPPPPPQHPLLGRAEVILEGDNLMLKLPSGIIKTLKITKNATVSLGKYGSFKTDELIGQPYGHTYEIVEDRLKIVRATIAEIQETAANNQNILSQGVGLDGDRIAALKAEGLSGREIIARQVEEHAAFELKTEYSKDKYMKRKEAKYLQMFTPLEPTLHNICEYNFTREALKTRDLRPDSLSQILNLANVRPGSRLLVVEDVHGLIVGGALERMGGQGRVMVLNDADSPPDLHLLEAFNFNHNALAPVSSLNWAATQPEWTPVELPLEPSKPIEGELVNKNKLSRDLAKLRKRKTALDKAAAERADFFAGQFDGVILCTDYEPSSVLSRLLPYIAGSAPVVVYSPHLEVLYKLQAALRAAPEFLAPSIHEPFLRQYQVLQGRTHPEMNGLGSTGCILSCHRVFDAKASSFASRNKRRKVDRSEDAAAKEDTPAEDVMAEAEIDVDATTGPQ